jgi:tripartite-type tricarboxylate transporter receptor subunit TctC
VQALNRALRDVLAAPDIKQRFLDLGVEARGSTPEELTARFKADIDKWAAVIKRAGIAQQ